LFKLETPTSAALIALVIIITPLLLFNHIRTFYIARYTSPTTHPSQPIYTFDILQKKEKKKKKKQRGKKNQNREKKLEQDIIIILMILITN